MSTAPPTREPLVALAQDADLLPVGARVLVAVSAGRDSTALACVLAALREALDLTLMLGHVDHGWRGPEAAAADRAAVEALASRLGVPAHFAGPPPEDLPRDENGARRFRYRALSAMARDEGLTHVATGHHAGDQAETLLMRLLRGSGPTGLAGIPPTRPLEPGGLTVVRPLLEAEPRALEAYLRALDIDWVEDVTNQDLSRDRAAVRVRLAERPGSNRSLAALAVRLRGRLESRRARVAAAAADSFVHHPRASAVAMPRERLARLGLDDLSLALRLAGEPLAADQDGPWLTRRLVAAVARLLEGRGALDLPHDLRVHVAGRTAWLHRPRASVPPPPKIDIETLPVEAFDLATWRASAPAGALAVDADVLGDAPVLRPLRYEDRFAPLGGSGRQVRVMPWLSKHGVPKFIRRALLVLEGAQGVAWIVGQRPDARHAVTERTERVAIVRLR